jgi:hypothetical protein
MPVGVRISQSHVLIGIESPSRISPVRVVKPYSGMRHDVQEVD